jgi:hypothetical protein
MRRFARSSTTTDDFPGLLAQMAHSARSIAKPSGSWRRCAFYMGGDRCAASQPSLCPTQATPPRFLAHQTPRLREWRSPSKSRILRISRSLSPIPFPSWQRAREPCLIAICGVCPELPIRYETRGRKFKLHFANQRDLTDAQWKILAELIPEPERRNDGRGRPWKERRAVLNGILWVLLGRTFQIVIRRTRPVIADSSSGSAPE